MPVMFGMSAAAPPGSISAVRYGARRAHTHTHTRARTHTHTHTHIAFLLLCQPIRCLSPTFSTYSATVIVSHSLGEYIGCMSQMSPFLRAAAVLSASLRLESLPNASSRPAAPSVHVSDCLSVSLFRWFTATSLAASQSAWPAIHLCIPVPISVGQSVTQRSAPSATSMSPRQR